MDSKYFTEKQSFTVGAKQVNSNNGHGYGYNTLGSPNWLAGRRPLVKPSVAGAPPWNSQFHLQHWRQSGQVLASLPCCCRDAHIVSLSIVALRYR